MNPVRKGEEKGKQTSTNLTAVSLGTNRYEDEVNKRTAAENEFVALKKVGGKVSQRRRFKTESESVG